MRGGGARYWLLGALGRPAGYAWREAGSSELTTRPVEERLNAYVTALMVAPGRGVRPGGPGTL